MAAYDDIVGRVRAHARADTWDALRAAGEVGDDAGCRVFLVGGMVRDALLGVDTAGDPDLAVQAAPPSMAAAATFGDLLAARLRGSVSAPSQFGTVKVHALGLTIDVATARGERYAAPGALPSVQPATVEEDMARRDFSANAIAVDLSPARCGAVLDLHGGAADIADGVLRTLTAASFADDPTRAFRAVRYMARLGLRLAPATEAALRRDAPHIAALSGDRVRHELAHILAEPAAAEALAHADALGILGATLPGLRWTSAMTAAAPRAQDAGPLGLLAMMACPLSADDAEALAQRLQAPRPWARIIRDAAALSGQLAQLDEPSLTPSGTAALLGDAAPEAALALAAVATDATAASRLRDYAERLQHVRPALAGDDLLALGVPQGPRVGALLRELRDARLDGHVATADDEAAWVRRSLEGAR